MSMFKKFKLSTLYTQSSWNFLHSLMYFSFVCNHKVLDNLIILGLPRLSTIYSSILVPVGTYLGSIETFVIIKNSFEGKKLIYDEVSM